MPRVLLTGSSGGVGRAARPALEAAGWAVQPFDLADGQDLRDPQAVADAMRGSDAVVHAGALAHDSAGRPADIVATNVLGTWHVLVAAEKQGVARVVYFSSAQVFGFAEGEGTPAYLPVDDDHPVNASRPYGMSKRLAVRALTVDLEGHHRLTLCGPGSFDCTLATTTLGWTATRAWEGRQSPGRGI